MATRKSGSRAEHKMAEVHVHHHHHHHGPTMTKAEERHGGERAARDETRRAGKFAGARKKAAPRRK